MSAQIDPTLAWPDHFVKYGFAVLRNQIDPAWCAQALDRIRERHVRGEGKDLPFDQWTTKNVELTGKVPGDDVLDRVFDFPNIRKIICTMFGTEEIGKPHGWSGQVNYQIFLTPFNPDVKPQKLWGGHIDFGGNIIPVFGDSFVMQVALHETEPHGGNITVIPGSHKLVQQRAKDDPQTQYPYDFADFPFTEPFEFVAKPGDVFLMHHLMFHSGNPCVGATHKPRIALHCQVHRGSFLTKIDPCDPNNSPWLRSFALNGPHEDPDDEQRYIRFCAAKKAMWGVWRSGDGAAQYRLYTGSDGTLHAKLKLSDGTEREMDNRRFNGEALTFEQDPSQLPAPSRRAGAATATAGARARAVMRLDPADGERLTLELETPDGPLTLALRRTEKFTGRLRE
jgi:hypothetical protein